jgi:hypothetical protein
MQKENPNKEQPCTALKCTTLPSCQITGPPSYPASEPIDIRLPRKVAASFIKPTMVMPTSQNLSSTTFQNGCIDFIHSTMSQTQQQSSASPSAFVPAPSDVNNILRTMRETAVLPPRLRGRRGGKKQQQKNEKQQELEEQHLIQIKPETTLHLGSGVRILSGPVVRSYQDNNHNIVGATALIIQTTQDYNTSKKLDGTLNRQPRKCPNYQARMSYADKEARNCDLLARFSSPTLTSAERQALTQKADSIATTIAMMGLEADAVEVPYFDTHYLGQTGSGLHEHTCNLCDGNYTHSHDFSQRHETICDRCVLRRSFLVDAKGYVFDDDEVLTPTEENQVPVSIDLFEEIIPTDDEVLYPSVIDEEQDLESDEHPINRSFRVRPEGNFNVKTMTVVQVMSHFQPENHGYISMNPKHNAQTKAMATGLAQPYFRYENVVYRIFPDSAFARTAFWQRPVVIYDSENYVHHLALNTVKDKLYIQGRMPLLYSVPTPRLQCHQVTQHPMASCEHIRKVFPFCQLSCQLPTENFYRNICPELNYKALDLPVRTPEWIAVHEKCPTTMGDVCFSTIFREKTRHCPQHSQCSGCGYSQCCCSLLWDCDDKCGDIHAPPLHAGATATHFFRNNRPQHLEMDETDYRELLAHLSTFPAVFKKNMDDEMRFWVKDLLTLSFPLNAKGAFLEKAKQTMNGIASFASLASSITEWTSMIRTKMAEFVDFLTNNEWVTFAAALMLNIFCVVATFAYAYYGKSSKMVLFFLGTLTAAVTAFMASSCNVALHADSIQENLNVIFEYCENGGTNISARMINDANQTLPGLVKHTFGMTAFGQKPQRMEALRVFNQDKRNAANSSWQVAFDAARDAGMSLADASAHARTVSAAAPKRDLPIFTMQELMAADIDELGNRESDSEEDEDLWGLAVDAKMQDVPSFDAKGAPIEAINGIYSILSSIFGFTRSLKLSDVNTFFQFGRNMKSVLGWMFNLFPECVTHWICERCPEMSKWLSWQTGPWLTIETAFEEIEKLLEDPSKDYVIHARMLRTRAKEVIRLNIAERWAVYAQKRLEKFEEKLQHAETKVFVADEAQRPLQFVLVGAQGIGKTDVINSAADILASVYKGCPTQHGVFKRGLGRFCEGLDTQKFAIWSDIGAGHIETIVTHMGEWQTAADGNFAPERSGLAEKGNIYPLLGIFQGSNYLHMPQLQGYNNLTAFHRRYDICAVAYLDKEYLANFQIMRSPNMTPEKQAEIRAKRAIDLFHEWIPLSTIEERQEFHHLRFRLVPRDEGAWKAVDHQVTPSAEGNMSREGMTEYPKWKRDLQYLASINVDTESTSYVNLMRYMVWKFKTHHNSTKSRRTEAVSYIERFFVQEGLGVKQEAPPVEEPKSKYLTLYKALGVVTCSIPLIMGAYGIYQLFKKFADSELDTEAKYVSKTRNLRPRKAIDAKSIGDTPSPFEVLEERLHQQVVLVQMIRPDMDNPDKGLQTGIMLDSTHVLTNVHCLLTRDGEVGYGSRLVVTYGDNDQDVVHEDLVEKLDFYAGDLRNDLVIITLNKPLRGMKKIVGHFATGKLNYEDVVGLYGYGETRFGLYTQEIESCTYRQKGLKTLRPKNLVEFKMAMAYGDCGSPLVAKVGGNFKIIAIANAGGETYQYGIKIDPSWLRDVISRDKSVEAVSVVETAKSYPSELEVVLEELDKPNGNYATVARVKKPRSVVMKTQLKKTPFYNCVESMPCRVSPAAQEFGIIRTQEAKHGNVRPAIPSEFLNFGEQCARAMFPKTISKMQPYTFDEVASILERDKSLGYGLPGKRTDYMYEQDGKWHLTEEIIEAVLKIENDKRLPCAIITPCLKDETLKNEKVELKKTRTFEISPFVYLIFGIRWCSPALDLLHSDCTGASKVGIDVCGPDWDKTFKKHVKQRRGKDNDWVDLDYAKMESRITWNEGKRYVTWLQSIVDDPDGNIEKYVYSMLDSIMLAGTMCYHRTQGNPSGMVGTVDINTYTNIMWIGACFKSIYGDRATVRNFLEFVLLALYGDDTVMSTHPDIDEEFNFFTLRDFLIQFAIEITPATKDSAPTSHVHQTIISFLKKKPLWNEQLNAFVPWVDWHTILDQLSWARDITPSGLIQICNSALAFYFFRGTWKNNGQIPSNTPTYDEARDFMSAIGRIPINELCTYEELYLRYAAHRAPPAKQMATLTQEQLPQAIAMPSVFEVEAKGNYQSSIVNLTGNNNKVEQNPKSSQEISAEAEVSAGTGGQTVGSGGGGAKSKYGKAADGISNIMDLFAKGDSAQSTPMHPPRQPTENHGPIDQGMIANPSDIQMESIDELSALWDRPELEERQSVRPPIFRENVDVDAKMMRQQQTISMIPHKIYNGLLTRPTVDGVDEATNLSEHAATELIPTSVEFGTSQDEMQHKFLRDKVCWLQSVDIPYSASAGTQLLKLQMSPIQIQRNGVAINAPLNVSALEYLCSLYYYNKGTIKLHFHVIGPREISGRLAVCLGYNVWSLSVPYAQAVRGATQFFDYDAENRSFTVEVAFQNGQVEKLVAPMTIFGMPDDLRTSCGSVYVYTASKLAVSNAVYSSNPQLNVFISGADDFVHENCQPPASLSYIPPPFRTGRKKIGRNKTIHTNAKANLSGQTLHTDPPTRMQVAFRKTKRRDQPPTDTLVGFAGKSDIIGTFSITPTTGLVAALNYPSDLRTTQSRFAYSASTYYRGDAILRVKPIAAGWAGGAMLVAYKPFYDKTQPQPSKQQLTSLAYVILDLASDEAVELKIPFMSQEEYFYDGCPDVGSIWIVMLNPLQTPTTGVSTQDVILEACWDNFTPLIPRQLPTVMDIPAKGGSDDATETTDKAPLTSDEKASTKGTRPVSVSQAKGQQHSFLTDMTRLNPFSWTTLTFTAGSVIEVPITNTALPLPGLPFHLSQLFAAFKGSLIYNIITDGTDPSAYTVIAKKTLNSITTGHTWPTADLETLQIQGEEDFTENGTLYANNNLPMSSAVGLKQVIKIRVHQESQYRWTALFPAAGNIIPRGAPLLDQANVYAYLKQTLAGTTEVYTELGFSSGARFAIFTGIPPIYLNPGVIDGTTVNYTGEFLNLE